VVPHVGESVLAAYARLRSAGLRVSIPRGLSFSSMSPPTVRRIAPLPGKRVLRGSVVTLSISYGNGVSSPAVPMGRLPSYQVPDFVGSSASAAYAWVRGKTLYFAAKLGPLRGGNAPDLFANYRVTRQRPSPGAMLTFGRESRSNGGRQGSFLPTPLTVDGVQGSSRSHAPSCTAAPAAQVVAGNQQAVITSRTSDADGTISWYGCLRTVGHQWLLNSGPNFDSPNLTLKNVDLAGHFAGLHFYEFDKGGTYYDQTSVYDLGTGRTVWSANPDCPGIPAQEGICQADALTINSSGFAAWHVNTGSPTRAGCTIYVCKSEQIYAHDNHGTRLVDSTQPSGIGTSSLGGLKLSGDTLTWTHDGTPHQITLG
jgi:hypothetical protein